ncbi:MAG: AAA family ATPase [Polyangiaceae bacterium]|nr:AAA family ATPase [Polyangiaceae bacterium]
MRIADSEVVVAALSAGATLLDTADIYNGNEAIVARGLAAWGGDRSRIIVATKAGLVRDGAGYRRDGRARHLVSSSESSRAALGVDTLDLLQLHAPDPRVPLETSVRALAGLVDKGHVRRIGLSNVRADDIEVAVRVAPVHSVQLALGPFDDGAVRDGAVQAALARGVTVIAYAPFGGPMGMRRIAADETIVAVATRLGVTPFEVVLAYLADLHSSIVPLPGPSRAATATSAVRTMSLGLDDDARKALDTRFPRLATLRVNAPITAQAPRAATVGTADVVVLMGTPGAGKSTLVRSFVDEGYERLNRDLLSGKLDRLARMLDERLAAGAQKVVLDNTYGTRRSRYALVEAAMKHGASIRCIWLTTSVEDAQINACLRMLDRYGRILSPEEMALAQKKDPNAFAPHVIYRYVRTFEPPDEAEGFTSIEARPFERAVKAARDVETAAPRPGRAFLLDLDAALWKSKSGARAPVDAGDIDVSGGDLEHLRALREGGASIGGIAWQPPDAVATNTAELSARLNEVAGFPIDVRFCVHPAGPPICWCRKPMPGLALAFLREHGVEARDVVHVGASTIDATFARRLGFGYQDAVTFFRR